MQTFIDDLKESASPVPVSIELIARAGKTFFVAYFRWQDDRNRLFFGELDWEQEPAAIREINNPAHLEAVLRKVGIK